MSAWKEDLHPRRADGEFTRAVLGQMGLWGPFSKPVRADIQADYGHLAKESDAEYAADKRYVRDTIPVRWLTPTQNEISGDEQEGGGTGGPFVVVKGNDYYLIDGHHRADRVGPDGRIKAWLLYLDEL